MFFLYNALRTYTETSPSQHKSSEFCRSEQVKIRKKSIYKILEKATRALSLVLFSFELLELRLKSVDNPHGFCLLKISRGISNFNVLQNNPLSQDFLSPIPLRDYLFQKSGRTILGKNSSLYPFHLYYTPSL